jgi:peptidoglycan/xylan/chitin deacetylase (PgdA/CDA1 family)
MSIGMLFPGGKTRALVLSYDDGPIQDRRLIQLLNQYNLKGTFHLNSGRLGLEGIVQANEVGDLYTGHEVSAHTMNHPGLIDLSADEIRTEVLEDRRRLEKLSGYPVRGMSYPFGPYNQKVIDAIHPLGIEYARTIEDTHSFGIPEDFLAWHPTMHQFGEAYYEDSDPERDKLRLGFFFEKVEAFLQTDEIALLYVWGHSWEFGNDVARWQWLETFFEMVGKNDEVCPLTHIELVDYIKAFQT